MKVAAWENFRPNAVSERTWYAGLVALTVFAVGEGFSSVIGNADGKTVSATTASEERTPGPPMRPVRDPLSRRAPRRNAEVLLKEYNSYLVQRNMKKRLLHPTLCAGAAIAMLSLIPATASAQWLNRQTPGIPRTKEGKADLTAPAPKLADGKPDLGGIWLVPGLKYLINIAADLKEVPFQPWAAAAYKQRIDTAGKDDPNNFCLPSGIPEKDAVTSPWKIVQTPGLIVILYESRTIFRQIFTDGRPLPTDPNPTWQGYSVGHWDGDTLVVETAGTNGKAWLDTNGHPVTDALKVTERFHRKDFGHMDLQITVDDPKAYTKPWTVTEGAVLQPDDELIEYICEENNRDVGHFVGK